MEPQKEHLESLEKPQLIALLVEQRQEIEKLKHIICNANRHRFGAKTEKISSLQIPFSFDLPSAEVVKEEEVVVVVERHTRHRRGRKPLPDTLPREEIIYTPEETHCACCHAALVQIGEIRTEELEKVPAQLKVIEHVRPKLACSTCKGSGVLVAPLPPSVLPLEGARPGPGLLADIVVSKYVDHLPLHRQEQMFLRHGIELSRKRMCDWIAGVVDLVTPLYHALKAELFERNYLQADETTIKIQDGVTPNKCHTGYLWGLHGPPTLIWFHYSPSRAGSVPKEILGGFQGAVQTDAYAGYNEVLTPDTTIRLACLAHVRRKFIEVEKTAGKDCMRLLKLIATLYKEEAQAARSSEAREKIRTTIRKERLLTFITTMEEIHARTLPRSPFADALRYGIKQKEALLHLASSDNYELDNNSIERQMKYIAIGRKNYYFAGSHDGAKRAAILYSLLGTCRLNKVNPWQWLNHVLSAVHTHPAARLKELLPQHWKPQPAQ